MKIKKIKNLILTFVICLFGAFAFNSVKTKAAVQLAPGVIANDIYYYYDTTSSAGTLLSLNVPRSFNLDDTQGPIYNVFNITSITTNNSSSFTVTWACRFTTVASPYNFTCDLASQYYVTVLNRNGTTDIRTFTNVPSGYISYINWNSQSNVPAIVLREDTNSVYNTYVKVDNYSEGYNEGYARGEESGLIEGQHRGYDLGYSEGYTEGIGNRNTLVGMIGAIFTGPVTMLQSIFSFEILGINFVEMLLGLTTLLVVIWLVKKFI